MIILAIVLATLISFPSLNAHNIKNLTFENHNLHPIQEPFNSDYLQVSNLHHLCFEEFGNPEGIPVLIVHGGPGLGCDKSLTAMFNSSHYRIIMFDQRGAQRSKPFAEMQDNTPQHSVHDMELLRKHLNIDKWILFGGSYGSLLSILYGQTYPEHVVCFVLRGIFSGRKREYENLFFGMNKFFPEAYQDMMNLLSQKEQETLIASMHNHIMNSDEDIYQPMADAFMYYDLLCAFLNPDFEKIKSNLDEKFALSVARAFIHYAANNFFLTKNQLLRDIDKIKDIPAIIVQGRYDLICLPQNAYDLHTNWPKSELWFIKNAGHSASEPPIAEALKVAMELIFESYQTKKSHKGQLKGHSLM